MTTKERALALYPLIDAVQDDLDVLQVLCEEGRCLDHPCGALADSVSCLQDAIEKIEAAHEFRADSLRFKTLSR